MILATSALVGEALTQLGNTDGPLVVAPFRSESWNTHLPRAKALILLLSERLSSEEIEAAHQLKVVGTFSVGMDHLPQSILRARNIAMVNTPGVLTDATADCALALLLAVSRRMREGEALVRSGQWTGWEPDQLLGTGLSGKTCGILGAGAIGQAFARRVWAMGMQVVFWDREGSGGSVSFGPDSGPRLPLPELLSRSAVLSLHCPLSPDTSGLLNAGALSTLPQGAIVINTARGGILDEPALIQALHDGHLGGVGLDVYAEEPHLNPRWLQAPRTVLLPHLGSATVETRRAMAQLLCDGVREALR